MLHIRIEKCFGVLGVIEFGPLLIMKKIATIFFSFFFWVNKIEAN